MNKRLFCFGFGASAQALAARLHPLGWEIAASFRDAARRDAICASHRFLHAEMLDTLSTDLNGATHILISAPPNVAKGDAILPYLTSSHVRHIKWIGYLSTTGVYGNHNGAWVDETTPPAPLSPRAQARLTAEAAWGYFAATHEINLRIFRLAGIYGAGRNPLARIKSGKARQIIKAGQVFSRIHLADIAAAVAASMMQDPAQQSHRIYNLCDDMPSPPQDVLCYAATLLGVAPPPQIDFAQADLSPMARSFYSENKRVRNARMKTELGVKLMYPSYREGLAALYEASDCVGEQG